MPSKTTLIIITIIALAFGVGISVLTRSEWGNAENPENSAKRVIALSPAIVEIVFALGAGNRVVGVSDWTKYPPEAAALPNCGGVDKVNTNYELISKLNPGLVIIQGESADMKRRFDSMGIKYLGLTLDKIVDIGIAAEKIAAALGVPEKGAKLKNKIELEKNLIMEKTKNLPRVKVLLVTWRDAGRLSNIATMGPGGFLDEAVGICGGENIFSDSPAPYPTVSQEEICARAPEVIIEMRPGEKLSTDEIEKIKNDWNDMAFLPAVKIKRVYVMTEDYAMVPGPRITELLKTLAKIIHPELDWSAEK